MARLLIGNIKGPQGAQGPTGPQGPQGVQGNPGQGVPTGGSAGNALIKQSGTDYDADWGEYPLATASKAGLESTAHFVMLSSPEALVFTPGKSLTQNAGFHNSLFRGKSLGTSVTAAQWAAIGAGTFDDLFIGDYWTINGIVWRIAAFDYWYNCGDAACTTHHVVIVPDANLVAADGSTTHWMNATNTTEGAYVGSDFYTGNNGNTGKAQCTTKINSAFGAGHILTHREYLQNAVQDGYGSAGAWYDSTLECMNEQMVYGGKVFGDIMHGANIPASYTISKSQLPLFALAPSFICNRADWWLRDVVSATNFAHVTYDGGCACRGAAYARAGLRPAFGIRA